MNKVVTAGFDYSAYSQRFVKASKDRAKKIRDYDTAAGKNFFGMGKELKEQREAFGNEHQRKGARGLDTWTAWVQSELGWDSRSFANRVIQVYEKFGHGDQWSPSMTFQMMRLLVAKSTPQELVDEVVELAKKGKLPTIAEVRKKKKMIDPNPLPTPKEAKKLAKEIKGAVLASDDRWYTPMDEKEIDAYVARRDCTFTIMEAIEAIATVPLDPGKWLDAAEKRWLSDLELGSIDAAGSWLGQLAKDYKVREKIIDNEADTIEKICRIS